MSGKIMNNVVPSNVMRDIQSRTLNELASILKLSFGPNGSNACIKKENALSRYTKDGHTIIGAIHYNGIMEQSIKDDIESITRHIVKTVGDGTTSAVILSSIIFDKISALEGECRPAEIVNAIESVVKDIASYIKNSATELTVKDVYDIAMISTNGNKFISETLMNIYNEFGNSVFIDVTPSIGEETIIKSYNGMTLNTGYCDSCYVTNPKNNTSEVDNPQVYFFEHPVDTREMGVYLDAIISRNIIQPVNARQYDAVIPTVIFAPTISQDMSSVMDSLTANMAQMPVNNRLPICIITSYHETAQLADLAKMCGAKMIRKYIDPNVYAADVANGTAPTPETIFDWHGRCDRVVAYSDKTIFMRPCKMYNEDGSYSNLYNNMVAFLEAEIKNSVENGDNIREVGGLKRRLHSLKSNMVELFVGGITQADRDSLRDLVEDAVLNIRSAADNGVGYAANMSAVRALDEMKYNESYEGIHKEVIDIISLAYRDLCEILFAPEGISYESLITRLQVDEVYNIRDKQWSTNVKSSIMSDVTILDTVSRIVSIMATSNQFIVPTAAHNVYVDTKNDYVSSSYDRYRNMSNVHSLV